MSSWLQYGGHSSYNNHISAHKSWSQEEDQVFDIIINDRDRLPIQRLISRFGDSGGKGTTCLCPVPVKEKEVSTSLG